MDGSWYHHIRQFGIVRHVERHFVVGWRVGINKYIGFFFQRTHVDGTREDRDGFGRKRLAVGRNTMDYGGAGYNW